MRTDRKHSPTHHRSVRTVAPSPCFTAMWDPLVSLWLFRMIRTFRVTTRWARMLVRIVRMCPLTVSLPGGVLSASLSHPSLCLSLSLTCGARSSTSPFIHLSFFLLCFIFRPPLTRLETFQTRRNRHHLPKISRALKTAINSVPVFGFLFPASL